MSEATLPFTLGTGPSSGAPIPGITLLGPKTFYPASNPPLIPITPEQLAAINPKHHGRYSPNLYRFLTNRDNVRWLTPRATVWVVADALWIGFFDDRDFIGTRMATALCQGAKASTGCYLRMSSTPTAYVDFWATYVRIGRCAIDPQHNMGFLNDGDRYQMASDVRTCTWCGATHRRIDRWILDRQDAWCPTESEVKP